LIHVSPSLAVTRELTHSTQHREDISVIAPPSITGEARLDRGADAHGPAVHALGRGGRCTGSRRSPLTFNDAPDSSSSLDGSRRSGDGLERLGSAISYLLACRSRI